MGAARKGEKDVADKEFLLGNRARELLRFTNQATRIVSDDISIKDTREIIRRISQLEDIREARSICSEVIHVLDTKQKEGFTRSKFNLYGKDMREIAKAIMRGVHAANNTYFLTEYEDRLRKIDGILDDCTLLLEYIQVCVEENIISIRKAGVLTEKVGNVKHMAQSWRKNDGGRARKLREEAQAATDRRQTALVKEAIRQFKAGK